MSSISEDSENWLEGVLSADSQANFEQESERKEAEEVLNYALSRISAEDRMVLTLVHLDGHSVKEAADLLGWSVITVKVRAHRSRNKLRKIITDLLEGRRSGV
jgi:RNA polymerase sigma-70 factor (ECF subfamily)